MLWPRGGMVTQRIANPFIPVRFWAWPPDIKITMNQEIFKIALNTENLSHLKNYTHFSKSKNSKCGDEIKIYLIIKNRKIVNFKYESESCIYCQASASLLSRNLKNEPVIKIKKFLNQAPFLFEKNELSLNSNLKKFSKIMNKRNIARKECLLLPFKGTLKALIQNNTKK